MYSTKRSNYRAADDRAWRPLPCRPDRGSRRLLNRATRHHLQRLARQRGGRGP